MSAVLMRAAGFAMIIVLGYLLRRGGLLKREDMRIFSMLVTKITLPAAIIINFSKIDMDPSMLGLVAAGFICCVLLAAMGYLVFFGKTKEEKAFGLLNATGYNIGCFTLPFVQSFVGPVGVAVASLFDAGNALICTGASYTAAAAVCKRGGNQTVSQILKRLFSSVPFDFYIIMTVFALFHIPVPTFILSFAEPVGGANSFLALLMIGLGLELHMNHSQVAAVGKIVGTRLVLSIILAVFFYRFGPFGAEMNRVVAILMFSPISSLCVPYTSMIEGDVALSSAVNSVSVIVGIISLTAAIVLLP